MILDGAFLKVKRTLEIFNFNGGDTHFENLTSGYTTKMIRVY